MKKLVVILVLAGLGFGSWWGYETLVKGDQEAVFITKPIARGDVVQTVSAVGTVEPLVKVIVGSQVSGRIKNWNADFNAQVTKGFVLANIDPDRFQTAYDQSEAELALAEARQEELSVRYKDAERERKRIDGLRAANNASENEALIAQANEAAAKAAWRGAEAGVKSAEARLGAARVDLEYTVIRSPIDGVVISRTIDVGQTVAASLQAPELFLIANDLKKMQVNANVSESDIGLVVEQMAVQFTVDAYPKRTFAGRVSQIRYNATILDGVVTYVTLISVENEDLALRPGMTANVTFEVARAENVLRIPNAALRFDPSPPEPAGGFSQPKRRFGAPTVYLLEKGSPKPFEVSLGLTDGTFTELAKGDLSEGAALIVDRSLGGKGSGGRPDLTRPLRGG